MPGQGAVTGFAFTEEQDAFRRVLRRFMADKSPPSEVRRLMADEAGWDPEVWRQMSEELGLASVHIPEQYGGQGFGYAELAITLEEMGRALLCAPYFSTVALAATAILNAGTEAQKRALLPAIAAGETTATLAFTEETGRWDAGGVETVARPQGNGYRLDGTKSFVVDGSSADLVVVLARLEGSEREDGLSFFTVAGSAEGLARASLETLDPTRKLARLEFRDVTAEPLGELGGAAGPFAKTMAQAAMLLANEMVGGAERLRESAVDYANMRVQFGRQIGSFQSLKHTSADMLLEVELAKSAAYYAAAAAAEDDPALPALASLAKASATEAYLQTAIHTIQIHGGIGFTWDNDTHLWFKRAKSSEAFLGDAGYHRRAMMDYWHLMDEGAAT